MARIGGEGKNEPPFFSVHSKVLFQSEQFNVDELTKQEKTIQGRDIFSSAQGGKKKSDRKK